MRSAGGLTTNCRMKRTLDSVRLSSTRTAGPRLKHDGIVSLKSLTYSQLKDWCSSIGEDARRVDQLWRWMYHEGRLAESLEATQGIQDGFSSAFCKKMEGLASMSGGLSLHKVHNSTDGTQKLVFKVTDGPAAGQMVETVLIPVSRPGRDRITVCVSSQVGCAMGCRFCFTGTLGLQSNLTSAQIVEQVVVARRLVAHQRGISNGSPSLVANVVFMGMGEPLGNLSAVIAACEILNHPQGLQIPPSKVTVSTVGLVPQIREFMTATDCELAVSIHAATDMIRDSIVPVNQHYNLSSLIGVLEEFYPKNGDRRVCLEYVLLHNVNDSLDQAETLVEITEGLECTFNLLEFNPFKGAPFTPSSAERIAAFRDVLLSAGRVAPVRHSRGGDQMAACGQLGGSSSNVL